MDHSVHLQEGRRDEVQPRNQRVRRPAAEQAAERIAVQMRVHVDVVPCFKMSSFSASWATCSSLSS